MDTLIEEDKVKLLEALKIAFLYMPEEIFLTEQEYAEKLPTVKKEITFVKNVLKYHGIDPNKLKY